MPFLIALAIGLALTPLARRLGTAAGLVDRPGGPLKIHDQAVPVLGGVAVLASTLAALAVVGQAVGAWTIAGVGTALAVGLVDDVRRLPTASKLLIQLAVGILLAAGGMELEPLGALAPAGTVLLALACMNAVNLVDGQDGLAGGLAAIAALGLAAVAAGSPSPAVAISLALAGALVAFLAWNRPPAQIFLGNGGAYGVGALLAVLVTTAGRSEGWRGTLAALVCLGVFFFDLGFTVARRLRAGGLTGGDRLHSYDLVAVEVGSRGKATLLFLGLGALAAALGVTIDAMPLAFALATAALAGGAAGAWGYRLWARRAGSS